MRKKFCLRSLGEVLNCRKEFNTINDAETYKRCRVRLHAKGIVLRDDILGSRIKTKKQQFCRTGEFLVAEIDAKVGGFGIVPPELDGAIVSSHYFLFVVNEDKLDRRFLDYYIRTKDFQEQVQARGSTNYAAIRPHHVLDMTIPLPPLSEQRRIVAKIEKLSAKIEEAKGLRREVVDEVEAVLSSELNTIFLTGKKSGWCETTVSNICGKPQYGYTETAISEPIGPKFLRITDIQDSYVDWDTVPYCRCPQPEKYYLRQGDILFARSGATTGKSYLVRECPQAIFASYLIRIRTKSNIIPELLFWFFQSPLYWNQVTKEKGGSAQPNMNGKKLSNLKVVFPEDISEQCRIVTYLDNFHAKIDNLKRLQLETQSELNTLIPSILTKAFRGEL